MALIKCSECGREVSDRAVACPGCGNPIAGPQTDPLREVSASRVERVEIEAAPVITTQATGKGPKVAQLIGGAMMCLGVVACAGSQPGQMGGAILLFFLGLFVFLGGRFAAWWNHG